MELEVCPAAVGTTGQLASGHHRDKQDWQAVLELPGLGE